MRFPPQGSALIVCTSILEDSVTLLLEAYKHTENLPVKTSMVGITELIHSPSKLKKNPASCLTPLQMYLYYMDLLKTGWWKGGGGSLNLVLEPCQSGPRISKRGIMAHKDRRKDKATKLWSVVFSLILYVCNPLYGTFFCITARGVRRFPKCIRPH